MKFNSIGMKVLLAYIAGVVVSISLFVLASLAVIAADEDVLSGLDVADRTADLAEQLRFDARGVPIGFDASERHLDWLYDSLSQETAYRVLDSAGNGVLFSPAGPGFWSASGDQGRPQAGRFEFEHDGVLMRAASERVVEQGREWFLQFAGSARFINFIHHRFALPFMNVGIALFSLILLFVFGACAYVTLRHTLKPLREVSRSAAAISPRTLHARVRAESVPAELAPLVDSFNRALDGLEHGYRVQQEFLATAAHELKTPLALIRAQIELEQHKDRDALLGDVEYMTRQVQQLLLLAEASEVRNYSFAWVEVHAVASEAAAYLQRMANAAGVQVVVLGNQAAPCWQADHGALFTLLKNLFENAIEHAPAGTRVLVQVDADSLSVRDWGPGVEAGQLTTMFARFWRGAHRRDHGAGLGLAICQEIALAHGWTLSAQRADPGLCLCIRRPALALPA